MKVVKIVLAFIGIVILLVLIVALFVKKEFNVEREIVINKPKQEVFNYIKMLKNQDSYSVWAERDPNMVREYKGTDGTVGFIASWKSDNKQVGTGEQEILKITEGERIDSKLRFKKPFETQSDAYMTTEAISATQTKVKWGFNGSFPYPMNIMGLFMDMDKDVGNDFARGLSNLKTILEK